MKRPPFKRKINLIILLYSLLQESETDNCWEKIHLLKLIYYIKNNLLRTLYAWIILINFIKVNITTYIFEGQHFKKERGGF